MPLISKKSIDEIRSRADIVAFIGDYTSLRRSGSKWKGLSPFTAEKTPSFFVDPEKGFYYCFSTGQGGDIFKFLMARENLTFVESVERVARRFGITIEYEGGNAANRAERSLRGELFDLHEFAAAYFSEKFWEETPAGEKVREYWTRERKFDDETARAFRLGFLPHDGSRAFAETAIKKGFSARILAASGIFVGTDRTADPKFWRSRFEARLIIPISDIQRRVIAFTARKIPGITPDDGRGMNEAKYINSSETEIFHKGSTLFNIDKAKDVFTGRRDGKTADFAAGTRNTPFVLVEGQLDAIRCWTCGIRTAVAGQGTGITEEQLQLLRRYSDRLDCLLDMDAAGQKAALRLAPIAFAVGLDLRFLSVPGGKDPDEFLSRNGAGGVSSILENGVPATVYIAQKFFPRGQRLSPAQAQSALDEAFEIISASPSEIFRSECVATLARVAGLDRIAVERDFSRFSAKKRAEKLSREGIVLRGNSEPERAVFGSSPLTTVEDDLLILALNDDNLTPLLAQVVPPEWLDSGTLSGRILNRIFAESSEGEWHGTETVHNLLETDEERGLVARLRAGFNSEDDRDFDIERMANECLSKLCRKYCERERRAIDSEIVVHQSDEATVLRLMQDKAKLRKILKNPPKISLKKDGGNA